MSPATSPTVSRSENNIHISLTPSHLNLTSTIDLIRTPKAGALVLFAGTTRDSFDAKPVTTLSYSSYAPLALTTIFAIASDIKTAHGLEAIAVTHRLGEVPVGEESIHIAVAARHRTEAWRAGEECLERVKEKAEIWKLEVFEDGSVWRANRDGLKGELVEMVKGPGE
ncbi:Molybdopterin biosynthesis MoaE [Ascodesmis nigricans]|uniref:Molybdopterin biosynthesis MoaE n=1 Tax=Ascodesmis nigricans TaxID=341454 RepID=A0A4S2MQW9_9PEZI|nr:Molybdopterin biosynthesis MoaE [Ascodesmis nigricans]